MLERRGELAQQLRELGKFRLAGAARRVRLALEAVEAVDDVDGVVGAALLAVIDDVDAGGLLLGDHIGDGRVDRCVERGPAPLSPARSCSTTAAGRGRLPVWVVRIRSVLRRITLSLCSKFPRASKQEHRRAARQVGDVGADSHRHCNVLPRNGRDEHSPGEAIMSTGRRRTRGSEQFEPVAGNGLLDRRVAAAERGSRWPARRLALRRPAPPPSR